MSLPWSVFLERNETSLCAIHEELLAILRAGVDLLSELGSIENVDFVERYFEHGVEVLLRRESTSMFIGRG